jgi:hypothetical protein
MPVTRIVSLRRMAKEAIGSRRNRAHAALGFRDDDVHILLFPFKETLNKHSTCENTNGNPGLFAGEGARATLVRSFFKRASTLDD